MIALSFFSFSWKLSGNCFFFLVIEWLAKISWFVCVFYPKWKLNKLIWWRMECTILLCNKTNKLTQDISSSFSLRGNRSICGCCVCFFIFLDCSLVGCSLRNLILKWCFFFYRISITVRCACNWQAIQCICAVVHIHVQL